MYLMNLVRLAKLADYTACYKTKLKIAVYVPRFHIEERGDGEGKYSSSQLLTQSLTTIMAGSSFCVSLHAVQTERQRERERERESERESNPVATEPISPSS